MEEKSLPDVDYVSLAKNGLQLPENDFNLIRDALTQGAQEAKNFLNAGDDQWLVLIFSNDTPTLGYSQEKDVICFSINLLNQQILRQSQLQYKDQLILFIPDIFYVITKYLNWVKLLGRESTIHHYQRTGSSLLKVKFPEKLPDAFSSRLLQLSDVEVEARSIGDKIAQVQNEIPMWKEVDAYLSKNYPQYFNKSIEELSILPKPNLPISFEMEYYLV